MCLGCFFYWARGWWSQVITGGLRHEASRQLTYLGFFAFYIHIVVRDLVNHSDSPIV
ncbi:hypothetical protein HanIR_Chr11g0531101 [Helianthus annuus]|nr:hypothetical protein HanIR_Chr11g0531101 [Helianthus annuus]